MDIRFVHAGSDHESRVGIDMTYRGGQCHLFSQFRPGDIGGIRNIFRSGRQFLAGQD